MRHGYKNIFGTIFPVATILSVLCNVCTREPLNSFVLFPGRIRCRFFSFIWHLFSSGVGGWSASAPRVSRSRVEEEEKKKKINRRTTTTANGGERERVGGSCFRARRSFPIRANSTVHMTKLCITKGFESENLCFKLCFYSD